MLLPFDTKGGLGFCPCSVKTVLCWALIVWCCQELLCRCAKRTRRSLGRGRGSSDWEPSSDAQHEATVHPHNVARDEVCHTGSCAVWIWLPISSINRLPRICYFSVLHRRSSFAANCCTWIPTLPACAQELRCRANFEPCCFSSYYVIRRHTLVLRSNHKLR